MPSDKTGPRRPLFELVSVKDAAGRKVRIEFAALPAQRGFFFCRAFMPVYIGGYGAGKTFIGALKALALAAANPGLPGALIAPTQQMAEEVTGQTLLDILNAHGVPHDYRASRPKVILPWGSVIQLRSADRPHRLKGLNLAWAGLDEAAQAKEEAWEVILSRVRHPQARQRQVFLTTTPEGFNWVYRRLIENPPPDCEVFTAPTRENIFLDSGYTELLRATFPPHLAEQYLEGRFVNATSGRVYHPFDRDLHVRRLEPWPGAPVSLACDFNVSPMVWLVIQHRQGRIKVLDEIALNETDTGQAAGRFMARWGEKTQAGIYVYGDAAGHHRDTRQVGRTDYTIIRREIPGAVMKVPRTNPAVKDRINAVNAKLRNAKGEVSLYIDPECRELIADLESLTYSKDNAGSLIDKSDPRRSHASDALGYFIAREYPIRGSVRGFKY